MRRGRRTCKVIITRLKSTTRMKADPTLMDLKCNIEKIILLTRTLRAR